MNITIDQDALKSINPPKWLPANQHAAWSQVCLDHPGKSYGALVVILRNRLK